MDNTIQALDCGHQANRQDLGGQDAEGKTFCYDCAGKLDAEQLRSSDRWTGYLSQLGPCASDGAEVSNWPGSLKIRASLAIRKPHSGGFGAQRTDVWFTFEGRKWHGVNRGDNQLLRCRLASR